MPVHEIQRPAEKLKETDRYENDLSAKEKAEKKRTRIQKENGDKERAQCTQAQTASRPQEPVRIDERQRGRS